ncbi:hypothetical protein PIROE2DRAFT_13322 [Piromyces sp. E2]|nr:hypothetical protein PIROE2DRAFT_13322 [Piromyces sp. E2]|eukprot:OUM60841.1 hypothetical protein PIROE2DRAFT_13322 [Piromyces sp. E2]
MYSNNNLYGILSNDDSSDNISNSSNDDNYEDFYGYDGNYLVDTNNYYDGTISYSQVVSGNQNDYSQTEDTEENYINNSQGSTNAYQGYFNQSYQNKYQESMDAYPNYYSQGSPSTYQNYNTNENSFNNSQENTNKNINNDIKNINQSSNIDKEVELKKEDEKAIQNTTIYLILSGIKGSLFTDIELSSEKKVQVLDSELIEINSNIDYIEKENSIGEEKKENNQKLLVNEFNHSFENKSIYLYKANVQLKNKDRKSFKIRFKYNNEVIQSSGDLTIQQYQQQFIYPISYNVIDKTSGTFKKLVEKTKNFIGMNNDTKDIKKFVDEQYNISNLQKFIIYKTFLLERGMSFLIPNLLEETQTTITKSNKIDYEYLLIYIHTLINNEKNFQLIPKENKEIMNNILSSLMDKKEIKIKKYDKNDYFKLVNMMDNYYYQDIINFIIKHKNLFPNLDCSNLKLIFEKTDKEKVSLNDVLMLSTNFNEYLKFFCSQEYFIEKNVPKIQFNKCPKPNENVNIQQLEKFFNILMKMDLDSSDLNYIKDNIITLINSFDGKPANYEKLIILKNMSIKYKNISITDKILNRLNDALHYTGKICIENDKWDNMQIINYIQEDVKMYYKEHKKNNEFAALISHINLDKIDDNFVKKFIGDEKSLYDYRFQFESNYNLFVSSVVKNVKNYHHLRIVYRLFNIEQNPKQNEFIIKNLLEAFSRKLDRINLDFDDIGIIVSQLYKLISNNDNYCMNKLIDITKKVFNEQDANNLCIFILNNFSEELNENLVEKLIKSINDFSNTNVLDILSKLKNEKIKIFIFKKLDNKVIKKEDIFDIQRSEKLIFLNDLINKGYFDVDDNDPILNVNYIQKTIKIIYNIIDELNTFNFDMNQFQNMDYLLRNNNKRHVTQKRNSLEERFFILSLGNQINYVMEKIYPKIVNKIKICNDILRKIDEIIDINSNYYPNEKREIIDNFKEIRNDIMKNSIKDFPNDEFLNKYNFGTLYREAHQITLLKNSKLFIEIHEYQKENYHENDEIEQNRDNTIFDMTKEKFFDLENLFYAETENKIELEFLENIISKIEHEEIEKEINIMKNIFEINEESSNRIKEKLELLKKRNEFIDLYKKINLLLNDFNLNSNKIRDIFKKTVDDLNNYSSLENLVKIHDDLMKQKLNILSVNSKHNKYALSVIMKMYQEPKLIKFAIDKNSNDIHQMGEFIDDSEDFSISLADIDQLETCMTFLEELKNKGNGKSEREFLDIFVKVLKDNHNYSDIGIKFEDSSGKYSDFYELYTNHLNPNELNKVHIRKIYEKSTFYITNNYPENKCEVYYYNNNNKLIKKDNDEMLELRTAALLRRKDQREQDYFKICENFATIISDIQEILKLLKIISSKGYFENMKFKINVNNGNVKIVKIDTIKSNDEEKNDKNDLKIIINELNDILEDQKNEVKNIYLSDPNTRMIHGRQFTYIFNFIRNNNIKDLNHTVLKNILKYVTNNSLINYKLKQNESLYNEVSLNQMYTAVSSYLKYLYKENNVSFEKINKNALILNNNKKGIYSYSCKLEEIERNTVYCAIDLTGNLPLAQTVLYCNEETTEDEIISFIYKSVKSEQNALFILIKPESLSREKKSLLIELLKELYSENPKEMVSCLLFIYAEGNRMDEVIMEIQKLPYHIYYDFKNDKEKNTSLYNYNNRFKKLSNIKVYSSEICGLGKSTLIKNDFLKEYPKYKYIYFPLGDNINKTEIIKKLLQLSGKRIALHLDLFSMNQIEIASEFLFSFLILKYYSQNENIFFYGNEMKIKVEIPNDFIDFKKIFPILNFFENTHITCNNIPQMLVPNDINSKIQIVANYIKNLNNINNHDIYIPDINSKTANCIEIKTLSQQECHKIVFDSLNIENPNYYQIIAYINILAEQLIHFSKSIHLNVNQLNEYRQLRPNSRNLNNIRFFFVDSLIKVAKHFITSYYDDIIKRQNITHDQQKGIIDLEKAKKKTISYLSVKKQKQFSFQNIKPSMILINEDQYSLSIIKTCQDDTEEYRLLKSIYQLDYSNINKEVIDYNKLVTREFLIEAKKVLDLYNPIDNDDKDSPKEKGNKKLELICDIVKSYVFTADNFMKLIFISLRLRTNIPVILMGETGCGKTSLIRIIAKLKDITMYTLNIHAGIEDNDIIEFIRKNNLFKDINKNRDKKESDETVWVFMDEANTCNSLGLITEILLKHSCKGYEIRNNVKLIVACNPYRINTGKKEIVGLLDDEKHLVRNLVYSVNPLPHSLLNFVFDFGKLSQDDIKKYISNMVLEFLQHVIKEEDILYKIQGLAEKSIYDAHEYIKNILDISSVSLRDIRRLGILFEWFSKDLLKNPYMKKKFNLKSEKIYLYSLNLSIYLCYFIRIFNKEKRIGFVNIMKRTFGNRFEFEEFPKKIQKEIANAVKLEKGIAGNKALLENLSAIFVCLNTKIPLFIIGKPGCSKSLSAQLIFKSMNGKDSSHEFFKCFPKVYTKSYQGSRTSTSKGILKIFEKARNSLKDKEFSKDIISAIYFDEMGLAEISKNNPLKVIHSQLEYDDNEKKIAFIGISNWPFDASKMNRGIHLSIPEPDQQDLIDTAIAIAKSYDTRLEQDYLKYYEDLSITYYKYKEVLKDKPNDFEITKDNDEKDISSKKNIKEFHGTRDFYHLIKTVSKLFIKNSFPKDKIEISHILNESIERNFGGLDHSIKIFKDILKLHFEKINNTSNYDVMDCINNNINDVKSRYLLVVTKSSINQFLITLILEQLGKNYVFYYGSNFEEDINKGYYSAKILNKIQITMNEDNVMILKNLACMYPSLYDLFNQNFRKVGESNYARIALGNSNTQNYKVNNNFRCIVLLDKNELDKQDPPFINRFEKHIIKFENLLDNKQRDLSHQIYDIIQSFSDKQDKKLKIDIQSEIINCDQEEIQGIIYQYLINNKNHLKFYTGLDQQFKYESTTSTTNKEKGNDDNTGNVYDDDDAIKKIFDVDTESESENENINENNIIDKNELIINNSINKNSNKNNDEDDENERNDDGNDDDGNDDMDDDNSMDKNNNNNIKSNLIIKNIDVNPELIKGKIFEKIVPTFSQDLIFFFKYSEYGKNHSDEYNNILNIYLKDEKQHKNIKFYLESISTNKHIIYTYSNILDTIFESNGKIQNNKYGSFTKEKTKNVFINQYNSEHDIDDALMEYYSKDNHNLCIIHFDTNDCIHLNHINYLIENNENVLKEKNNLNYQKPIIFIIHLERIIINTSNQNENGYEKIYKDHLISHLTKWNQIFIDNLNGKDINIKEIIDATNIDLFKNNELINLNKEFEKELFHSFSFIEYEIKINFSDIKKEEYIEQDTIQKLTMKKIESIKNNIIMEVFDNYNFENRDVDFISVLIKYMKSIYKNGLISTLIQIEQEKILSTKLLMEKEFNHKFFDTIYQKIIQKFEPTLNQHSVFSRTNIELIMGISYPFIIPVLENINKYIINNLKNDYLKNENNFSPEDKENYVNERKRLENNIQTEFEKQYFAKILCNKDENSEFNKEKLLKILFKDYVIYYLSKCEKKFNNKNILNFFNTLYELFISMNNSENANIDITFENMTKFVLFIECYSEYIYIIIEQVSSMDGYIKHFLKNYISKILENSFCTNKEFYTVNDILFNLYESMIYCILNINQSFGNDSNENEKFEEFMNEIKLFSNKTMNVNIELCLMLKQIFYLQDFVNVKEEMDNNGIPLKENLNVFLEYLKEENETYLIPIYFNKNNAHNNIDDIDDKNNVIIKEFKFLKEKLSPQNYQNIAIKLLNNKMKISKNENYRLTLLRILCSNHSVINKSKNIFETIFKNYHLCPKNKSKNMDSNENDSDVDDDNEINEVEKENQNTDRKKEDNSDEEYDSDDDDEEDDDDDYDSDEDEEDDDNDDENGIGVKFLQELERDKNKPIILFLNESNNNFLDEVLLSLFDEKFSIYFNCKKRNEEKILNQSLQIFTNFVYSIENANCTVTKNNKLMMLYCISYIKYYCYHLSQILYNDDTTSSNNPDDINDLDISDILEFLNRKSEFRKIIKIYILRVLNKIFINNYKKLLEFINHKEVFDRDFDFSEKVPCSLNYLFLHNATFNEYKKLRENYVISKNENFKNEDEISELVNEKTILLFYDLIINEELSSILKSPFKQDYYTKLCNFVSYIIKKMNISELSDNILSLYYNYNNLNKELPIIQNLSSSDYEMLLYSHKFSFLCSLSKPNTVYTNILSPNVMKNINQIYIPGGEPKYNLFIKSIEELQNYRGGEAVYICSCGQLYKIGDCGGPVDTDNCVECNELIGGTGYRLHKRDGHFRICFNNSELNRFPGVPGRMYNDLKREVEQLKSTEIRGFEKVLKKNFISQIKSVRKISNITYRILSFIFYSCILCDIKLNYISDEESRNFYYENKMEQTSIFSILKDIWNVLEKELDKKGINNIQCFLNMIMPNLSQLLSENNLKMETAKERDTFENKCHQIIEEAIENYKIYYPEYINNNNDILKINDDSMKSIIEETSDITKLPNNKYPLIKYFYAADYPSYDKFYDQFKSIPNYSNQYPVISTYLQMIMEKYEKMEFLESFHSINPLVVYVIKKYSNKISRGEAKKIIIKDELYKDKLMKKLFKNFRKGWEKIHNDLSNYDCHGKLPVKNITSEDYLAYILNDNIENDFGKYIATAYKDFITYQNEFFSELLNIKDKQYLNSYLNQIKKKIIVQNATSNEVVSLTVENEIFDSFDELIYAFSYRNGNKKDGNYKKNYFDFNSIEIELSKILLTNKRCFYGERDQLFISYNSEGFTKNYNIITDFRNKIEKEELLEKEDKNNIKNSIERFNYEVILVNLQSLFLYFTNKRNISGNELLSDELTYLHEKIIKLDQDFYRIIHLNQLNIKLNQLIDLYNYIEYLNYHKIINKVSEKANNALDKNQIELLNRHFNQENLLISKKDLCQAIQRFISRYLISDQFKNYEWNIFDIVNREGKPELWDSNLILSEVDQKIFDDEIDRLYDIDIKIGQSISFSEYFGLKKEHKKDSKNSSKKPKSKKKIKRN